MLEFDSNLYPAKTTLTKIGEHQHVPKQVILKAANCKPVQQGE